MCHQNKSVGAGAPSGCFPRSPQKSASKTQGLFVQTKNFFFFSEQLLYIGLCSRPRKFYLNKEEKTPAIMETGEKDNNPINFNKEKTFQRQISALKKSMSGSWNKENCHLISVQVASKNHIQLKYGNFDDGKPVM